MSRRYQGLGLDLAILLFDASGQTISFSGAHCSLLTVHGNRVTEYKGTRRSIVVFEHSGELAFPTTTIPYEPGMKYLLMSDGLIEQCGGPKRLPFGKKRLFQVLGAQGDADCTTLIDRLFEAWVRYQGSQPQRDDMTLIACYAPWDPLAVQGSDPKKRSA